MNFFLLADSGIWYIWPETTALDLLQVVIIVLLFLLVILVGRLVFMRKKTSSSSWTHILNYAYNRKLSSKEISVLEHFFGTLELSVREKANLLIDKKVFQSYLYSYLKKYHSDSVESYVRILDKLFPWENNLEIKSLLDLHLGEVCAVEFDGIYFLARVMNRTEKEVLLSINDNALSKDKEGKKVNLYFYRNSIGGFLMSGCVKKVNINGILFFQEGEIHTKGEEHLVAELVKEIQIFPWGINAQDSSLTLHDKEPIVLEQEAISEEESGLAKQQESIVSLKATMIRISDRAILINIKDPFFSEAVLKKIDIWEMPLDITLGMTPIVLKGKIMKSNLFSDSYIFKFIGPSESDMKLIFDEIKKHSPERGFIS